MFPITRSHLPAAALFTVFACAALPAHAVDLSSLREALVGSRAQDGRGPANALPVGRYVSDSGASFVFDRTGRQALLRFERSPEIWALKANTGPRGDIIYRNDVGEPVLMATRFGGLTLFTPDQPMGVPVSVAGQASAFKAPLLSAEALIHILAQASVRCTRTVQHLVAFDAPDADPQSSFLIADAALISTAAVVHMAGQNDGKSRLSRLKRVLIRPGRKADARMQAEVLQITIAQRDGVAGRPSSEKVLRALGGS